MAQDWWDLTWEAIYNLSHPFKKDGGWRVAEGLEGNEKYVVEEEKCLTGLDTRETDRLYYIHIKNALEVWILKS